MLTIVEYPDPILRQMCEPCEPGDPSLKRLAKEMAKAMYKTDGVGIAAPQVGVLKRIIVVDCDVDSKKKDPLVLVNPVIMELQGDPVTDVEGCLSCPGIGVPIERQPWVRVQYMDLDGDLWEIESDGLLGRCLQHEIDHLNGKTLFESCKPEVRLQALQDYETAKANGARPGDVNEPGSAGAASADGQKGPVVR